ncbi:histidine phosphatase family protein [Sulfuritalea sp.]|uniref:histidine phosphatase family protein n=1 Tax=Sulfuritalea sp. TaxID=2480090 RepID=UPI001AC0B132|nr:histidine phosphatase family protein [Sulfuritalea sp.]MBN8474144.1 histidine phosphatase family protein [Sulfuritalea sp.]
MTATRITRFCLIRHGETDWNGEKRIQGQIDIDLNARGEAQARAVADGLQGQSFAAIYSSDLRRAWHTASIAAAGLGLAVSPAPTLRERHFGVLQGVTASEAREQLPHAHHHHLARTPDYDFDSGESLVVFAERVMSGLDALAECHLGQSVLAFTHGGVLDIAYRAATRRALDAPRDFMLPNAAFNWLERDDVGWRLISWADCGHLQRALDEVPG